MTKITVASPEGDCPTWLDFLDTVTGGDVELQRYLQRMAGYCLTGVTTEHALFFLYGTGANGKSVFANTLTAIIGDYVRLDLQRAAAEATFIAVDTIRSRAFRPFIVNRFTIAREGAGIGFA